MIVEVLIPCALGDPGYRFEPIYPGNVPTWVARGLIKVVKEDEPIESTMVEHDAERAVIDRSARPRKIKNV